jgi:DNA repair ATPase RecN
MSANETRIRNLISAFVEERGRMEKLDDIIPLKIEEHEAILSSSQRQFESTPQIETRLSDAEHQYGELESVYRKMKMNIDGLSVLSEHVLAKTRGLNQPRDVMEKSNGEAGKLNVIF